MFLVLVFGGMGGAGQVCDASTSVLTGKPIKQYSIQATHHKQSVIQIR